jgi:hypothetical protein
MSRFFPGGKATNRFTLIFYVIFYAFLVNLPFWVARPLLGFFHDGWFCVEYAVVGLIALFVPSVLAALLLLAVILTDMLCAVCETFVLSPMECLRNLGSLGDLPSHRFGGILAVLAVTLLIVGIAGVLPGRAIRKDYGWGATTALTGFLLICGATDGISFVQKIGYIPHSYPIPAWSGDSIKRSSLQLPRLMRRTVVRLATQPYMDQHTWSHNTGRGLDTPAASASAAAFHLASLDPSTNGGLKPNLVLVLLESWGLAADDELRKALVQPYMQKDLTSRYQVLQGTVPFFGPTVAGEGRELCDSRIAFQIVRADAQSLHACLPDRLDALGYHTSAVHGMAGGMFKRADWYKRIGLQELFFRDQFLKLGLPICPGAFIGTCDASVAAWIEQRLAASRKPADANPDFIYWVTLNSHIPVATPPLLANRASCTFDTQLAGDSALCSWYQLVENVQRSVAAIATSDLSRPTIFIVVGDHAPPFSNATLRNGFSDEVVPYVVLTPRSSLEANGASGR